MGQPSDQRCEAPAHRPVVMKFGGTSVENATAVRRVAQIVRERVATRPVAVVSALAGVTDALLGCGENAASGALYEAYQELDLLRRRHADVAGELLSGEPLEAFSRLVKDEFESVREVIRGVAAVGEFSRRTSDRVVGTGELLASSLVAHLLTSLGVAADWVDSRHCVVTDDNYGAANPQFNKTNSKLRALLPPMLATGHVPVLGGFIGATEHGTPTTLGRGGSDFSAAIVAAALNAETLEIWTDVDGIMTADPRLCPEARLIPAITFEDAAELACFGAKVLHPATLLPAMKEGIPVYVRNSRSPEREGTRILAQSEDTEQVKAITAKSGMVLVRLTARERGDADLVRRTLDACDRHQCAVELFSAARGGVTLLVNSVDALPKIAADLGPLAQVHWENHKTLVCLFGQSLAHRPTVAQEALRTLADLDVSLVGNGVSEQRFGFLVDEDRAAESVRRLHHLFFPAVQQWGMDSCQVGA